MQYGAQNPESLNESLQTCTSTFLQRHVEDCAVLLTFKNYFFFRPIGPRHNFFREFWGVVTDGVGRGLSRTAEEVIFVHGLELVGRDNLNKKKFS